MTGYELGKLQQNPVCCALSLKRRSTLLSFSTEPSYWYQKPPSAALAPAPRAVTEGILQSFLSKKDRIRRCIDPTRDEARSDVFDDIEDFYNRVRMHSFLDWLSCWTLRNFELKVENCLLMRVNAIILSYNIFDGMAF